MVIPLQGDYKLLVGGSQWVRDVKVGPPADPQQNCKNPSVRLRKRLSTVVRRTGISISSGLTRLEASVSDDRNPRKIRLRRQFQFHVAHPVSIPGIGRRGYAPAATRLRAAPRDALARRTNGAMAAARPAPDAGTAAHRCGPAVRSTTGLPLRPSRSISPAARANDASLRAQSYPSAD